MDESIATGQLTRDDQQAAFKVINQLGDCQTREQLKRVIKSAVIPLMNCSGVYYARFKNERNTLTLLDEIHDSSLTEQSWNSFIEVATQQQLLASTLMGVTHNRLATDLFCCTDRSLHQANNCCVTVAIFDSLKPTIVLYFCRLKSKDHYYTVREFNLVQIIRCTLLQTIKAILYLEKCHNLQLVMDHLPDDHKPLALVNSKGVVMYKNQAFKEFLNQENFNYLSTLLSHNGNKISVNKCNRHMIKVGRRLYEVALKPVNDVSGEGGRMFLLYFSRAYNNNGQLYKQWRQAGLTKRELQIATLLYQGVSARRISETLFLS